LSFVITDKSRTKGGRKVEGVSVMKDKEVKLDMIEVSHTLGGWEGCVQGRWKWRGCRPSFVYYEESKRRCYSSIRYLMIHQSDGELGEGEASGFQMISLP
jgi:hypothetical protein